MTFSVVARCSRTEKLGVAIASAIPGTGAISSFVCRRSGAIATQAWCNPYIGIQGLALLSEGLSAREVLEHVLQRDPQRHLRQVGIVDAQGRSAAHTGHACTEAAGHRIGEGYAIQGNMLADSNVLDAMQSAFLAALDQPLADRLLATLVAGDEAGGDLRGKQSAAILIHDTELFPWLDLRVDDHTEPVRELARIKDVAMRQLIPFIDEMSTEFDWSRMPSPETTAMLALSPDARRRKGLTAAQTKG